MLKNILVGVALTISPLPALAATPPTSVIAYPNNPELKAMFDSDQAARMAPEDKQDWEVITRDDAANRKRVRELLAANKIQSGQDYFYAAFIFQHGYEADDYLLAHSLAMAAMSRGHPKASWIAAATLDRYLHKIGKAQIYGTQKHLGPNDELTADPYDRNLITDAMRRAASVPALAEQK